MAKQWTKNEKLNIIKESKKIGILNAALKFDISTSTIKRWKSEVKVKGEGALEWGSGTQSKGNIKKFKSHDWIFKEPDDMSVEELREALKLERALKKHLAKTTKEKYFAIFNVKRMFFLKLSCLYLKVSRYGYLKWLKNGKPKYKNYNRILAIKIRCLFYLFKKRYGYNMITLFLNKYFKERLNPWVVYRYMKTMSLKAAKKKKVPNYDKSGSLRFENLLNRNFNSKNINEKWVTDVTYIKTINGNVYLSVIKDLFNSEIVDWKLSVSPNNKLCHTNLISAIKKRGAPKIIHSDQGAPYTNETWERLCKNNNINISMSRRGNSPDNGACESFFGTFKNKCIYTYKVKELHHSNIYKIISDYI
ncbi:transposase [Spiroplasma litorale]|uniref:Transposase n=1 Tax=Spiroplasma litorale TaxID=216942 RepID=A0A0K1W2B2_9MOLU|nr:IS3 family transposase [Spiroplasma litorale]AKX34303.1 transposase [Spiroplasma litorale]